MTPKKIDINGATTEELAAIPGVSGKAAETIAAHIYWWGPQTGNLSRLEQLKGVGKATVQNLEAATFSGSGPETTDINLVTPGWLRQKKIGLSDKMIEKIHSARPFNSWEEVAKVPGVGPKTLNRIKEVMSLGSAEKSKNDPKYAKHSKETKDSNSSQHSEGVNKKVSGVSEFSRMKERIVIENIGEMVLIPKGKFKLGISDDQIDELDGQIRGLETFKQIASVDRKFIEDLHTWYISEIRNREAPQQKVSLPAFYISAEPIKRDKWLRFAFDGGYKDPSYWQQQHWQIRQTLFRNTKAHAENGIKHFVEFEKSAGRNPYSSAQYIEYQKLLDWYEEFGIWYLSFSSIYPEARPSDAFHDMTLPWVDAYAYCRWLSTQSEKENDYFFTLPFETEWEKAIKGGKNEIWPWGNNLEQSWFPKRKKDPTPENISWAQSLPEDQLRTLKARALYENLWSCFLEEDDYVRAQNKYQVRGIFVLRDNRISSKRPDQIVSSEGEEALELAFLPNYTDLPEWTANTWEPSLDLGDKMESLEDSSKERTIRGGLLLAINEHNSDIHHPSVLQLPTPGVNIGEFEIAKYPLSFLGPYITRTSGSRARGGGADFRFRVVARDVKEAEKMDIS